MNGKVKNKLLITYLHYTIKKSSFYKFFSRHFFAYKILVINKLFHTQKALYLSIKGFAFYIATNINWHRPTLPRFTAIPSALAGLTSLFGMGRGRHRRYRHLNVFNVN